MPAFHLPAATFQSFGFAVLRGVLTGRECRTIAGEFTRAFSQAFEDLRSRRTPAWLPGLADATPGSAALAADDGRLWTIAEQLLDREALPVPPEVALLRGITPWHYDDPLGLRAVKFLGYVSGEATGLRLLPLSHAPEVREVTREFLAASVGTGRAAATPVEAAEREVVPGVAVTLAPGDLVAIDLHVWHCYRVPEPRILWSPEFLAWPDQAGAPGPLAEKFEAVAGAGAPEDGRRQEWPVWRDWLRSAPATGRRRLAIDRLRRAGAFEGGRDRR